MGGNLVFTAADGEYELERLYAKGDKTKKGILTVKKDGQVVPESVFLIRFKILMALFTLIVLFLTKKCWVRLTV